MNNSISQPDNKSLNTVVIDLMGFNKVNLHITPIYSKYGYIELTNSYAEIREIASGSIFHKYIDTLNGDYSELNSEGFIIIYPDFECEFCGNGEPDKIQLGKPQKFKSSMLDIAQWFRFEDKQENQKFLETFSLLTSLLDLHYSYRLKNQEVLLQYNHAMNLLFPGLIYKIHNQ